jgi:phage shock protein PspC (stress-responsive transcriptional regulator)
MSRLDHLLRDSGDNPIARHTLGWQPWAMAELRRPRSGRVIAGVCAGIAHRYGWRPNIVRLVFVLSCILPGPQFLIYVVLWLLVPAEK